jgi:hypothetical protein
VFPNVGNKKIQRVLFIDNFNVLSVTCLSSIASGAIDCNPACVWPYAMRSTSGSRVRSTMAYAFARTTFDRSLCVRPQITALKSHGASKLAMAARATRSSRADEEYVRT